MNKFLAVVKREYVERVRSRMFILMTFLGPVVLSLFGIAPAVIFSIKAGGPVRVAVVDQTGRMYGSLYNSVMEEADEAESAAHSVDAGAPNESASGRLQPVGDQAKEIPELQEVPIGGRSLNEIKAELDRR